MDVGRVGTVEQIETGVVAVLRRGDAQRRPVLLKLGEAQLSVLCADSKAVLTSQLSQLVGSGARLFRYYSRSSSFL